MERRLLSGSELAAALAERPLWRLHEGKLRRELRFAGFGEAFAFMTRVALIAESLNHHPDWCNAYNTVRIDLVTHDLAGLSTLDLELARQIDRIAPG
ncbi:MAG: 4a-hydroxytetrahydrobiopterin dehydratase [Candidatus Lambdaproteobacteria bacterium]|nr:4a-hydroxytetrahydrobiopterin dehydratase [Candidatus Lambdaproteobacteria bacterium]